MTFSVALCLGLFSFFLGSAFGSLFCVFAAKIFKKRYIKCRISLFCASISFAVIFATCYIVFLQQKYDFSLILKNFVDFRFLLLLFAFGLLIISFLKSLLPIVLFLYFILFFHTKFFLSSYFGENKNISMTLLSANEKTSLRVYKIHSKLLLPISRFYFKLNEKTESVDEHKNFMQKKILEFDKWLLSDFEEVEVEIPKANVYPALYILTFNKDFDNFYISITRTL